MKHPWFKEHRLYLSPQLILKIGSWKQERTEKRCDVRLYYQASLQLILNIYLLPSVIFEGVCMLRFFTVLWTCPQGSIPVPLCMHMTQTGEEAPVSSSVSCIVAWMKSIHYSDNLSHSAAAAQEAAPVSEPIEVNHAAVMSKSGSRRRWKDVAWKGMSWNCSVPWSVWG